MALIVVWLAFGPIVGFTNTFYQLVINTATTIITFLMVFLIQADANRGFTALHGKLDEIIRASDARNALIGLEDLSTDDINSIRQQIIQQRRKDDAQSRV